MITVVSHRLRKVYRTHLRSLNRESGSVNKMLWKDLLWQLHRFKSQFHPFNRTELNIIPGDKTVSINFYLCLQLPANNKGTHKFKENATLIYTKIYSHLIFCLLRH